jgi:hypothetical protein
MQELSHLAQATEHNIEGVYLPRTHLTLLKLQSIIRRSWLTQESSHLALATEHYTEGAGLTRSQLTLL